MLHWTKEWLMLTIAFKSIKHERQITLNGLEINWIPASYFPHSFICLKSCMFSSIYLNGVELLHRHNQKVCECFFVFIGFFVFIKKVKIISYFYLWIKRIIDHISGQHIKLSTVHSLNSNGLSYEILQLLKICY